MSRIKGSLAYAKDLTDLTASAAAASTDLVPVQKSGATNVTTLTLAKIATLIESGGLSSATPSLDLIDSDTDDGDVSATLSANATATGTGAEDIDVTLQAQVGGSLSNVLAFDASADTLTFRPPILAPALTSTDAALNITGQVGSASNGGTVVIAAGAGDATNAGGVASLTAGGSGNGATGNGGAASLTGGAALSTNGTGGASSCVGGVATGTGTGGAVAITGGASAGASGTAGAVTINAGALAGGTAGQVNVAKSDDELGFYGVTAVVRPTAYTQTFATADKTHAARTAATLTDNSGGTANTTIADITEANNAGSADRVPTEDAIADLAAQVNALIVDQADTAQFVNSVVDDLQALGLLQ